MVPEYMNTDNILLLGLRRVVTAILKLEDSPLGKQVTRRHG